MQNNYVLISGATSGIGHELAKLYAKDGRNLILISRNQSELEKRLKNVDNVSLLHVCHFLDIDRKWYEKQYDMYRESYKLYIQRHK